MTSNWQIWIDTGGTFTDGIARDPQGNLHRTKVLSSSRLRAQIDANGRLVAPWLTAPIFAGYTLRVVETGQEVVVKSLDVDGTLVPEMTSLGDMLSLTVELFTHEEAPVLAARLLTQTPLHQPFPLLEMRLGTTRGTNALLERKGGRVALVVTRGFRDLLVIGTQQRPNLFQLAIPPADILYDSVLEVNERLSATGEVLQSLTDERVEEMIAQIRQTNPDSVAVSLLNAYRNPSHEHQIREALQHAGFSHVTCSTDVSTTPGYVARTQTTVVDAYLNPVLRSYLDNVQQQLGEGATLRIMSSSGGLVRADLFRPKDSLLSGPAGGVIGASAVDTHDTQTGLLTLDMGGTSTDVARILGQPDYRFTTKIGPFELQLPSLAIETVAAGGGSVCWFDAASGRLRVGPHSAGANPGPACYGAGAVGQPLLLTITDVNLLLGRLHPAQFGIPIFPERAQVALNAVVEQVGGSPDAILNGFARIADEAMAGAIRTISIARGFDPTDYSLLVFGGAGGLHGCSVARLLGMTRLILPFDGGLLSAYGMGKASIERMASRAVLQPLEMVQDQLPALITQLEAEATRELRLDVGDETPVGEASVRVFMRLQGQESSVEIIPWFPRIHSGAMDKVENHPLLPNSFGGLSNSFKTAYQQRYGHYPEGRTIEIESVRVMVGTAVLVPTFEAASASPRLAMPTFHTDRYPAYDWTKLQPGDTFNGPALLLNTTSSAFIEEGWEVVIGENRNAVIRFDLKRAKPTSSKETPLSSSGESAPQLPEGGAIQFQLAPPLGGWGANPPKLNSPSPNEANTDNQLSALQLELFTRRFMSIAEEMGTQLQRTAFSTNVKERLDFSCALLDANAELVANAPHIPVHLGSLGVCARLCLEKLPLNPGDVIITNHPQFGGSHLPDVTLLQGVFTDENELVGYVINRAHHAEIGGKVPGSMPPDATTLIEEGVVLEPQYVVKNGQFLWETGLNEGETGLENRFTEAPYPTRALAENRADIEAALASLRAGETALLDLVRAHGLATVHQYMDRLKQSATKSIETVLQQHAGQVFTAEESLDDGHTIQVQIQVQNGQIEFDFSGTSGVHPHNLNANVSILHSAVLYVLRLWCAEEIPLNEGLMAPVRFVLPESSFLNPIFPDKQPEACPAVVGGNTEVSQRLVDTLLKALGLAACSYGTMNNFLFGNENFGYYETIGGGTGATIGADGRSAVHQHMTNTKLTDPEELERRYPVRLREFSIRAGSGGGGNGPMHRWKGGDGIIREIEFLTPVQATLLSQHRVVAPYGLNGGEPGQVGRQTLIGTDGTSEELPGIFTRAMQAGERIRIETPGGGGVGEKLLSR